MREATRTALEALSARFARIARLDHAATYLDWDRAVMMPPGGAAARAAARAELAALAHEAIVATELEEWLATVEADGQAMADAALAARLREMRRERREATALPAALVRARIVAGARCEQGWREQRAANDWRGFLENFRPVVALAREAAEAYRAAEPGHATPYAALMARYCRGEDPARVDAIFATLAEALPPLLARVVEHQRVKPPPLLGDGPHEVERQAALGRRLALRLGFAFERGRLDTSLHPFSCGGDGDLRITTRYAERDPYDALEAIAHEIGHASYEGGLPEALAEEPLGKSRSMSVHESQSLWFEKHLFGSEAFQRAFAADVHEALPALAAHDARSLWRARLGAGPSLIRVEADEVSYPLHVLLRHQIERDLIDGAIEAEEVPEAWDGSMRRLLGLDTRGDFANGCLQDIHWSDGTFGYFPSYTLGAVHAAQIAVAVERDLPDWKRRLGDGDWTVIGELRGWLGERIWSRASSVDAETLLRDASGAPADPAQLLAHLERRYLDEAG